MSQSPEKPPDANPVFQSMLDAGRAWYRDASPGDRLPLSCCVGLLNRSEPNGAEQSAEERVRAWAEKQKFQTTTTQQPQERGKIAPPLILTVTITR